MLKTTDDKNKRFSVMREKTLEISKQKCVYNEPCFCPHCNRGVDPRYISTTPINYSNQLLFVIVHECTLCNNRYFTVSVTGVVQSQRTRANTLFSYPPQIETQILDTLQGIALLSPDCVNTYRQAMQAKQAGLDELAGFGVRKALDYLFFDFGQEFFPNESDFNNDPKTTLHKRIERYVDNADTKELATACAWLGNDFTHPIRRHEDKDIDDLLLVAESLFYHVQMVYVARTAKSDLE